MRFAPIRLGLVAFCSLILASCGEEESRLDSEHAEEVGVEFYKRVSAGDEAGACELATKPMRNAPCEDVIGNLSDLRGKLDEPEADQVNVIGEEGATIVAGVVIRGDGFVAEALLSPDAEGDDWAVGDFNVYYDR